MADGRRHYIDIVFWLTHTRTVQKYGSKLSPVYKADVSQIKTMRRQTGNRLSAFAPVNDLSQISRTSEHGESHGDRPHGRPRDMELQGGKVLGDEWAEHVVTNRNGIMLRAS